MGSCPLLTPPAGGWILAPRINKAILKCAAIAEKINLKPDLNRTNKPSAQDKLPSARQKTFLFSPESLLYLLLLFRLLFVLFPALGGEVFVFYAVRHCEIDVY